MTAVTCQNCGALLAQSAAGALCPACLLRAALDADRPAKGSSGVDRDRPRLPRRFGHYELLAELGRGGMGVVYRATQTSLDRVVAVKLLLAGAYSSEAALQRFRLEAEAAARLQHPNIVEIHDYGEVDGQPFYAMDLVAGRSLAERCAGRPLPARAAAELLRSLAGAVEYAHRRGVLHRDLKPSNVLVDETGRPRITDFGLVKLLGRTEGATMSGQVLGSPGYAAPEQVTGRGTEVGPTSDVYGLGALFYHLLTGHAPFNAATPTETFRLVLDTDPVPPRLLNPTLPRDLETICLKCLAKNPCQRYTAAAEVVAEVERFLAERPILAQRPGTLYRLSKFTRRHRAGVAATAAALLALVAGMALALAGFRRAVVQQREANAARGEAEHLVGLMTEDLRPLIEQRGGLPQLVKTTEATVRYFESLPPKLRNAKTDRAQADALSTLARLRGVALDDRAGAAAAMRETIALREKIVRENPDDPEAADALLWDESLRDWIEGDIASQNNATTWETRLGRWRELQARYPENLRIKEHLAMVLGGYAYYAGEIFAKPAEAAIAAAESQKLTRELMNDPAWAHTDDERVGLILRTLAGALARCGDTDAAVEVGEQSLAYCTKALESDPGNLLRRQQAAEAARDLSYIAFSSATPEKGRDAERVAREHYRLLTELSPENQEYRFMYAWTHRMECYYLLNFDTHVKTTRKAIRECDALLEPFIRRKSWDTLLEHWTINRLHLARIAAQAGETGEARAEIERANARWGLWQRESPAGSVEHYRNHLRFLTKELVTFLWLRDGPEATRIARECLAEVEAGLQLDSANTGFPLRRAVANAGLGIVAQREGRFAAAIPLLQAALESMDAPPRGHTVYELSWFQASARVALVEAWAQNGDKTKARALAESLLSQMDRAAPKYWPSKEWRARAAVLVAGLLGPEESTRRSELLDAAEKLLTAPEAEGRITVFGKEDLATIARLRRTETVRGDGATAC